MPARPNNKGTKTRGDVQGYVTPPHVRARMVEAVDETMRPLPLFNNVSVRTAMEGFR